MVVYFCNLCNFSTNIKSHFNRHLNTKKHSINTENECKKNITNQKQTIKKYNKPKTNQKKSKNFAEGPFFFEKNENFLKKLEKNETKMKKKSENLSFFEKNSENLSNFEKKSQNISNFDKNLEENHEENRNENQKIKNIQCEFCNKTFTHMNSLYRHKNKRCKKRNTDIDKQKLLNLIDRDYLIEYVKKEKIIESVINKDNNLVNINLTSSNTNNQNIVNVNTITNIQNNNIQNNIININPLGQEDISFITEEIRLKILENLYMAVPELIKVVHDRDCNRNFFIKNINKQIMGYVDKDLKIKYDDYKTVIEKIIDNNIDRLHLFYIDLKNKIKPNYQEKLNKVIKLSNDRELNDKYNSNIKYYVLDNSHKNKRLIKDIVEN